MAMESEALPPGGMGFFKHAPHLIGAGIAGGIGQSDFHIGVQRHNAFHPIQSLGIFHHAIKGAVEHAGKIKADQRALRRITHQRRQPSEAFFPRAVQIGLVVAGGGRHEKAEPFRAASNRRVKPAPVRHQHGALQTRQGSRESQHRRRIRHLRNGLG